jgi:hypothetical protein
MGPYYRNTSQGTGAFFDMFYEQPILMGAFVIAAIGAGVFLWLRSRKTKKN